MRDHVRKTIGFTFDEDECELIKQEVRHIGKTLYWLASYLGISYQQLNRKMYPHRQVKPQKFSPMEIAQMREAGLLNFIEWDDERD